MDGLVWKRRRFVALLCGMLTMLVCGTMYAFPLFGPQLAERRGYTQLQINVVAASGSIGLSLASPFLGHFIDQTGPRRWCILAAVLLFFGYQGLAAIYAGQLLTDSYLLAAFCFLLVGAGSFSGYMVTLRTNASNWPRHQQGTAIGILLSLFALSGLVLSLLQSTLFVGSSVDRDSTHHYLVFLAIVCACGNVIASAWMQRLPIDRASVATDMHADDHLDVNIAATEQHREHDTTASNSAGNLTLRELLRDTSYSGLIIAGSLLNGSCQMYIANVGTIVQLLYNGSLEKQPDTPPPDSAQLQHAIGIHVATIGATNATTRLLVGFISDYLMRSHQLNRCWLLLATAIWLISAQLLAYSVQDPLTLVAVSAMVGVGLGSAATLAPAITNERWGSSQFARNWGLMFWGITAVTTALGSMFGALFDARRSLPGGCIGSQCYRNAFLITAAGCTLGMLALGTHLTFRRGTRHHA
ncbi:major facilitator superfamily domain-containing protein [Thamnocephalis sphaerospora]|uniref:Major facilitator superfamily domain-containing protein n=1 Tax=Thamnocephalis sphaerospora TaxID=78915 RepID=A0A4P9XRA1_9FUNG|nr:major facilitator superfamily domain-containing protein [Thamnocephalis sphaerospora]|eukprot:RKP08452.1 major facilitator superfamily domain-containing protein [Thamnocephalis sphaerospora]